MKREILFKAKRVDNGEWIEGQLAYFFDQKETPYIMPNCYFATREMGEDENDDPIISDEICFGGFIAVHPETVCQFTGLLDKNGKKIFEGDYDSRKRIVMWNKNLNLHCLHNENLGTYIVCYYPFAKGDALEIEIIGNIHD